MHLLNKMVVATLPLVPRPMVRFFAGRYIAGETLLDAVRTVRQLNSEGVCATLDVLGEEVTSREEALAACDRSIQVLHTIAQERLDSNLSMKLTSLGLRLEREFCLTNVRKILKVAEELNIFVRIDMEDHTATTETIDLFRVARREYTNVGIVLQAYLRRSMEDANALLQDGANFRLCKGIYREPENIAFKGRGEIQQNYLALLKLMLDHGSYVGIATHDSVLIDGACRLIRELKLNRTRYEFQMLLGVRPELRRSLVADGHKVRLYVPFGESWYGYSLRRFKENPEIAGHVFRAIFKPHR
jgi:proline dehydrogenase